eukprot:5396802-Pleurochrysis_carterae.AAC.1
MALPDAVPGAYKLRRVHIDPVQHTGAGRGEPVAAGTRAYAHAQIAVLGLAELGLHAAPARVARRPGTALLGLHQASGSCCKRTYGNSGGRPATRTRIPAAPAPTPPP